MKRLSILFVGLLSAVLVFSVVGLADTSKSIESQLTLKDVIDISLTTDSLGNTDLTQNDDLDTWNQGDTSLIDLGSFDVQVLTLTSFKVTIDSYVAEWFDSSGASQGTLDDNTINSDPVKLDGTSTNEFVSTLKSDGTTLSEFSGSNNINSSNAGESVTYNLKVDPSELTNDYASGDYLRFDVGFLVTDDTT